MEAHLRSQKAGLDFLTSQAEELNFYQAVRLLENQANRGVVPPKIQYHSVNTQAFTPNAVAGVVPTSHHTQVQVNSFGLLGQQGPVPDIFSEIIQRNAELGNKGPEAFLNLFNHRFVKLLFDIKKQLDPMLFNDNLADSTLYKFAHALFGLWTEEMHEKLPLNLSQLLGFCLLFIGNKQNYSSLKQVLESVLQCEASIEPCAGAWRPLPSQYQAKLGSRDAVLGEGIGLGCRYWDNQAGIDLHLKVKSLPACAALRPGGKKHQALVSLLSFLTDGHYALNVTLSVPWRCIPQSEVIAQSGLMILGNTLWLKSDTAEKEKSSANTADPELKTREKARARAHVQRQQTHRQPTTNAHEDKSDRVYPAFTVYPSLAANFSDSSDFSDDAFTARNGGEQ